MKLKGTKTCENLMKSFVNESQASIRYGYYASQAKKDGYVQIQNIFLETSQKMCIRDSIKTKAHSLSHIFIKICIIE